MAKRSRPAAFIDDPLWYKDAVIYQLHIKSFFDSNNDGIGDFAGLISKLDYIAELGVNTLWLLPFYPSPRRDDATTSPSTRPCTPTTAAWPMPGASSPRRTSVACGLSPNWSSTTPATSTLGSSAPATPNAAARRATLRMVR